MMQIVLELADEVLLETLSKKHKISEPKISLTYEVMDKIFSKPCQKSTKSWTEEPFFDLQERLLYFWISLGLFCKVAL